MATVPGTMLQRWRSGDLAGDAKHACVVRVRQGYMDHGYFDTNHLDGGGSPIFPPLLWQAQNHHCWKGKWTPTGDWVELPNISTVKWSRAFSDKGTSTATIVMDNIAFTDETGIAGVYHVIERGHFSPMRGTKVLSRPSLWAENAWKNVLNGGYQIEVWEGYGTGAEVQPGGSSTARTFVGLIEDCELESHPDHITITARDFNVLLTDQRLMGWNKAREIRSPITFADRKTTQGEMKEYGRPVASSGPFPFVDKTQGVTWTSDAHSDPNHLEWVEIHLPSGHYEEIFVAPLVKQEELFISISPMGRSWYNDSVVIDSTHHTTNGWVDFGAGFVPGTDIPFVRRVGNLSGAGRLFLNERYDLGQGSVIRIWFDKLKLYQYSGQFKTGGGRYYTAGVKSFYAFRFGTNPSKAPGLKVNAHHWVLVEDAADVIRMLLIWAGFQEWHVEDFGWSLTHPLQFGEDKFFMDVIDEILAQGNFVFYMAAPSTHDLSLGVPHFERQKATDAQPPNLIELRDRDMLEAATAKWDLSNLPYVIRYRGAVTKNGHTLDQDLSKRCQATYYPPWSGQHYFALGDWEGGNRLHSYGYVFDRVAGVRRQFGQTMGDPKALGLSTEAACLFACLLAAVQYGLQMVTGEVQIAGMPYWELNDQVGVVEEADGINSRMWVAAIESDHTLGEQGAWTMKLSGAYIDTPDLYMVGADYRYAYSVLVEHRPPSGENHKPPPPNPGSPDVQRLAALAQQGAKLLGG